MVIRIHHIENWRDGVFPHGGEKEQANPHERESDDERDIIERQNTHDMKRDDMFVLSA